LSEADVKEVAED